MNIPLHEVRHGIRRYAGEEPPGILELDPAGRRQEAGPVRYEFTAQRLAGELLVRGRVSARLRSPCDRCGAWFEWDVCDGEFTRAYAFRSDHDVIDLTPDVREAILLLLPIRSVCSPSCRGLCAHCGADLNRERCACGQARPGPGWSALNRLTLD